MAAVELAPALGLADAGPVGGAVAGAGEPAGLDEGLGQDRGVAVAGPPVGGQPAGDGGEQRGGEVGVRQVGADEEPGVAADQVRLARRVAGSQPIQSSRGAHFQALAAKAKAAIGPAAGAAAR